MSQKWNLQDIRPQGAPKPEPPRSVGIRQQPQQDIAQRAPDPRFSRDEEDSDFSSVDVIDGNATKRKRIFISALIVVLILGVGFFVNLLLAGATVTVQPKTKDITVQSEITAKTNPQVDELGYELLTLEATGERQVKASGKQDVQEKATGKIFIYNTGATTQPLVKNTRFETKDGLIFRITDSVTVPPAQDGKPGMIAADVSSDGAGDQYNIQPQRFTIPGLKGSDQFNNMYGESTAAFSGGFSGEKYILDDTELATAQQALHVELRNTLLARLKTERPAGFIAYNDAVAVSFESLPATDYGDSLATIKERARLQVPLFKEDALASFIAKQGIPDYKGDSVRILDPMTLTFSYDSATTTTTDISNSTELNFMLKGSARIVWQLDEDKLKNELVGTRKKDSPQIFSKYGAIRNAQAELRPFWATSFPKNPNDIAIKTVLAD